MQARELCELPRHKSCFSMLDNELRAFTRLVTTGRTRDTRWGIVCQGTAFEAELTAPAFGMEDLMKVELWKDRKVFREKSYEQIKAERMK